MNDEIQKILKLLENGKINSEEAERLITAVSANKNPRGFFVPSPPNPPKMQKEFVRRIETIPDQVGQAITTAFGTMGSTMGRKTFPDVKKFAIKVVSGRLGIAPGESEITFDGTAWPLKTRVEDGKLEINAVNTNATIEIPTGIGGSISGVSADIQAKDLIGEISMEQVSGDTRIERCGGDWKVITVSGDIEIDDFKGNFYGRSRNGDIEMAISGEGEYELDTISGDVEVEVPTDYKIILNVKSRDGDVDLPEGFTETGVETGESGTIKLSIRSINGDIEVNQK